MTNFEIKYKPFLRWAGGKTWLLKSIQDYLPEAINNYYEPFLGGGSVFIHLQQNNLIRKKAFLSDVNSSLINSYRILKESPQLLIDALNKYENTQDTYYSIRSTKFDTDLDKAVQFIFLNRTSFNGIYRENLKGEYNVPYGNKIYKELHNSTNLLGVSNLLTDAELFSGDFSEIKMTSPK